MNLVGSSVNFATPGLRALKKETAANRMEFLNISYSWQLKKNWRNYMVGYTSYANLSADNELWLIFLRVLGGSRLYCHLCL